MPVQGKTISVVIASVNGLPVIDECLSALEAQAGGVEVNVVVADRCGAEVRAHIRKNFPSVAVLECSPSATVPELRAAAIDACFGGGIVAVIEDHCIAPAGWATAMVSAHSDGHKVVGGPIRNLATAMAVDRASFLIEYSRYMPPVAEGPAREVPGNNVSYSGDIIKKYHALFASGAWDTSIHQRMADDGVELYMTPAAEIGHRLTPGALGFAVQKFHFARSFAGKRVEGRSRTVGLAFGAASALLPVVLLYRIITELRAREPRTSTGVTTIAWILVFLLFWAAGEAAGYIMGPGSSSAKVR